MILMFWATNALHFFIQRARSKLESKSSDWPLKWGHEAGFNSNRRAERPGE